MVATIPEGVYTMAAEKSIISANAPNYRTGRKKTKSALLDELTHITHLSRKYLSFVLRHAGQKLTTPNGTTLIANPSGSFLSRRGRKKRYGSNILPYLLFLWQLVRYPSSLHLAHFIRLNHPRLFCLPKLKKVSAEVKANLQTISPSTVDRLLRPIWKELLAKRRYRSNPFASWLKKCIPVETYHNRPSEQLGY